MNLPQAVYVLASRSVAGGFDRSDEEDWFRGLSQTQLERVRKRALRLRMEIDPDDALYNEAYEFLKKLT